MEHGASTMKYEIPVEPSPERGRYDATLRATYKNARYLKEFACRTAPAAEFIRLCEQESGRKLKHLFERWLRENAYPEAAGGL
ncbi:MAG: hypothetical protein BWY35_01836 [Firmicutes bacterium ADurb.Bin248]|nr:MAG: hypothetical protein BWY35_01836 [Firmicutes bacterium ADurb.Bin248]HPK15653.1 hypothetical protein [Clostridia bacterium]